MIGLGNGRHLPREQGRAKAAGQMMQSLFFSDVIMLVPGLPPSTPVDALEAAG
ncbi:MAG: hypothetical protein ACREFN_01835 [Acetobacteraceae bacterium]